MFDFKDKTVLTSGALYGLGEQFAYDCADSGADLILTTRCEDRLKPVQPRPDWYQVLEGGSPGLHYPLSDSETMTRTQINASR